MVKEIIDYKKDFLANKGNIDINSDLVQELYKKVLNCNSFYLLKEENQRIDGCSFYKNQKVTLNNLSNFEKLLIVLQNLPEKSNLNFEEIPSDLLKKIDLEYEQMYNDAYEGIKEYTKDDILKTTKKSLGKM